MFVNIPLSYVFSYPFTLIDEKLFLPVFILSYWLTNLLGFLMLHHGITGLFNKRKTSLSIAREFFMTLAYTFVIVVLVRLGWISMPTDFLSHN